MKRDWILYLLVFPVIIFLIGLLWFISNQSNQSSTKPIGNIVYRHKIAQRRSSSSFLWDYLNQGDIVYNKDTIRTDASAEAMINLHIGTVIDLDSLSMIVLNVNDPDSGIRLERGNAIVKHNDPDKPFFLEINSERYYLQSGEIRAIKQEKEIIFQALGFIKFSYKEKEYEKKAGETFTLINGQISGYEDKFMDRIPENGKKIVLKENDEIEFSWTPDHPNMKILIQEIGNQGNQQAFEANGNKWKTKLTEGNYEWRLKTNDTISSPFRFRVYSSTKIQILNLKEGEVKRASKFPFLLYLQWEEKELCNKYKIFLEKGERKSTIETLRREYTLSFPDAGQYKIQIQGEGQLKDLVYTSDKISLELMDANKIPTEINPKQESESIPKKDITKGEEKPIMQEKPAIVTLKPIIKPITPVNGAIVDMSKLNALNFKWNQPENSSGVILRLYNLDQGRKMVFEQSLSASSFSFQDLSKLDEAKFEWTLETEDPEHGKISASSKFKIILSEELEKPNLE